MSTRKFQLNVSGFTGGLNTEASVLNVLTSEFMDGSVNVELLRNAEVRRRRGLDFIGESDVGGFLQSLTTATTGAQQFSPSAIYIQITAPNGNLLDRIVVDINNTFRVYEVTAEALRNVDTPLQTITRGDRNYSDQAFYNMQFVLSGDKLFFTGRHCQYGYLKVDADNTTLAATYLDVKIRDVDATAVDAELITRYSKTETLTSSTTRPTCIEFFGNRIWLSGDPKYPNTVYFSQAIEKDADLEKFYQEADPFDANDPDLVEDDGGVITILGAGKANQLKASGSALFAGTQQGVWQISGRDGIFKATDFSVRQVLTDQVLGHECMVRADQQLVVFGRSDIWIGSADTSLATTTSGVTSFKSLIERTNSTMWRDVPIASKAMGRAIYNQSTRKVFFFFCREDTSFNLSFGRNHQPGYSTHALIFDVAFDNDMLAQPEQEKIKRNVKGAFYMYEFADNANSNGPYIACPFLSAAVPSASEPVTDNSGTLVVDSDNETVAAAGSATPQFTILLYVLHRSASGDTLTTKHAFGVLEGTTTRDWSSDATYTVSYDSTILTGVQTGGDVLHRKGGTYVYFVFKKVETGVLDDDNIDTNPGGCLARVAWQWSTSTTSPLYGDTQQIYIPDRYSYALAGSGLDGHSHTFYKMRVRGFGNALQVVLTNDDDKDFHLVGWGQQFWGKID